MIDLKDLHGRLSAIRLISSLRAELSYDLGQNVARGIADNSVPSAITKLYRIENYLSETLLTFKQVDYHKNTGKR